MNYVKALQVTKNLLTFSSTYTYGFLKNAEKNNPQPPPQKKRKQNKTNKKAKRKWNARNSHLLL